MSTLDKVIKKATFSWDPIERCVKSVLFASVFNSY